MASSSKGTGPVPKEFSDNLHRCVQKLFEVDFGTIDQDDDGALTIDELTNIFRDMFGEKLGPFLSRTIFEEIDDDGDQEITPREFFKWRIKNNPEDYFRKLDNLVKGRRKTAATMDEALGMTKEESARAAKVEEKEQQKEEEMKQERQKTIEFDQKRTQFEEQGLFGGAKGSSAAEEPTAPATTEDGDPPAAEVDLDDVLAAVDDIVLDEEGNMVDGDADDTGADTTADPSAATTSEKIGTDATSAEAGAQSSSSLPSAKTTEKPAMDADGSVEMVNDLDPDGDALKQAEMKKREKESAVGMEKEEYENELQKAKANLNSVPDSKPSNGDNPVTIEMGEMKEETPDDDGVVTAVQIDMRKGSIVQGKNEDGKKEKKKAKEKKKEKEKKKKEESPPPVGPKVDMTKDEVYDAVTMLLAFKFSDVDGDSDNKVTKQELANAFGQRIDREQGKVCADYLFDKIDKNGDGVIKPLEFLLWKDKTDFNHLCKELEQYIGIDDRGMMKKPTMAAPAKSTDLFTTLFGSRRKRGGTTLPQVGDDDGIQNDMQGLMQEEEEVVGLLQFDELANNYWKQKEEEAEQRVAQQKMEERQLVSQFEELFDLSLGLAVRPKEELYEINVRPLLYTIMNILLTVPSIWRIDYFWSLIGVSVNLIVLLAGTCAESTCNCCEVCGNACCKSAFVFTPGVHFTVLDAWFGIQTYRDRTMGMTLDRADRKKSDVMFNENDDDDDDDDHINDSKSPHNRKRSVSQPLIVGGSSQQRNSQRMKEFEYHEDGTRKETLLSGAERMTKVYNDNAAARARKRLEKKKARIGDMQIVPPPFSYHLVFGYLLLHTLLAACNAYYSGPKWIWSPNYPDADPDPDQSGLRDSWSDYCRGSTWNDDKAIRNGECLIRFSGYLALMSFSTFTLFCSFVILRNVRSKPISWIKVAKTSLLAKFPPNPETGVGGAKKLLNTLERRLLRIKAMHHFKYRCCEICGVKFVVHYVSILNFLCSGLVIIGCAAVRYQWLTDMKGEYVWGYGIFAGSIYLAMNSLGFSLATLLRIYNFYWIAFEITVGLVKPIFVRSLDDLIIWWEVRKFYYFFKMPVMYVYGAWGVVFLTVMAVTSIFFLVLNIVTSGNGDLAREQLRTPTNVLLSCLVLLIMVSMFGILLLITQIYSLQVKHSIMLRHEESRLDAYGAKYSRRLKNKKIEEENEQKEMVASTIRGANAMAVMMDDQSGAIPPRMSLMSTPIHEDGDDNSDSGSPEPATDAEMQALMVGAAQMQVLAQGGSFLGLAGGLSPQSSPALGPIGRQSTGGTPFLSRMTTLQSNVNMFRSMGASWRDLKTEREVAAVGLDSHKFIETIIYLIDHADFYPKVLGIPVTRARLLGLGGYFAASILSIITKFYLLRE